MTEDRSMEATRQFALDAVRRLRAAGYQALWAGGCVRDQLLGAVPKDYDIATDATPDQVRAVFGRRRTIPVGEAFGVISVRGPRRAGPLEVATFRRDAEYVDGRHPESVSFTDAAEDARRRDFTINGLFFDPLGEQVIDYVGGQRDLERGIIRAIGDAHERFAEDKLRMLRAVRFAATFDFRIESATFEAVRECASELRVVSAERIADELRRMMVHPRRRAAVELMADTGLLVEVLPEAGTWFESGRTAPSWHTTLDVLGALDRPTFAAALAAWIRALLPEGDRDESSRRICRRWKLSNQETEGVLLCVRHESCLREASRQPWPRVQRVLIHPRIDEMLEYTAAVARVSDGSADAVDFCRQRLAWPRARLDPPRLLTGDDLRAAGLPPGPRYATVLNGVRDAQLRGEIRTADEALQCARRLWSQLS